VSEEEALSVRELLKGVYDLLAQRNEHENIVFEKPCATLIAYDFDLHRKRRGYMRYAEANIYNFNGKQYLIARGEKCGSYPAEPYDSDILYVEVLSKENIQDLIKKYEEKTDLCLMDKMYLDLLRCDLDLIDNGGFIESLIERCRYFENSLIVGYADGRITLEPELLEMLGPKIEDMIYQDVERDSRYIAFSTLKPVVVKQMKYKPEFVEVLTETIEKYLRGL